MTHQLDTNSLKKWFISEKRDLPWRMNPSPYRTWISEVMLQQTQVAVVIPYFVNWMAQFPTIPILAQASLDEVIKAWEGLGYYSRARNLHAGAQYILEHFNGELPSTYAQLQEIKGLGPYTIGAILSFAFHQKIPAVDGNVQRVLSRYFMIKEDISKPSTVKMIRNIANSILPIEESWLINEGLIELGALVCTKQPKCFHCPLQSSCQSYAQGITSLIPFKSAKIKTEFLFRAVAVIKYQDYILLKKGEKGKIMSDLYEFPFFETSKEGISYDHLRNEIHHHLKLETQFDKELPAIQHSFTRYQVRLNPVSLISYHLHDVPGFQWYHEKEIEKLPFSSGHRRLYQLIKKD